MTKLRLVLVAVLMAIMAVGLSHFLALQAQTLSSAASLSGTVSDPSGARVPKATIKLTDSEKGITRSFTAGSAGEFSFPLLSAGNYTLEATAGGFKTTKQTGIVLNAGDSLTVSIQLRIGTSEQVTVSESATQLQTEDANVGTEIAQKQVDELPLNFRNVLGLVLLNSSVNNQTQQQLLAAGGTEDTADQDLSFMSFGGGFFGTTAFLLDGGWNVAGGWGGTIYVPRGGHHPGIQGNDEFVFSRIRMEHRECGQHDHKSGTSDLHFTLSEYLRNNDLDANTYFRNLAHQPIPPDHRNQFAAAGGGPLYIPGLYKQRDKTFFFANYEGLRLNNAGTYGANVPTSAQEGGDFSAQLGAQLTGAAATDCLGRPVLAGAIYNPYTTRTITGGPCGTGSHTIRDPYPGNKIPSTGVGAVDALAAKFAAGNYWPAPKNPTSQFNYNVSGSQTTQSNEYGIRIDHHFSPSTSMYGRWSRKWETKAGSPAYYGANDVAGPEVYNPDNRYSIATGASHIFSPTFVMNGAVEYNRWTEGNDTQSFGFKSSTLGLPGIIDTYSPQFPQVGFGGSTYAPLGATTGFGQASFANNAGSASIDLNKTHKAHSLSFGYMGDVIDIYGGQYRSHSVQFHQRHDIRS